VAAAGCQRRFREQLGKMAALRWLSMITSSRSRHQMGHRFHDVISGVVRSSLG
jgi:hypothetical protein